MTSNPQHVLVISNTPWGPDGGTTTNRQRTAMGLAECLPGATVYYLNTKGWRPSGSHASLPNRVGLSVGSINNRMPFASRSWGGLQRRINMRFTRDFLARIRGMIDVCVVYDPLSAPLCAYLRPTRVIYDCVDLFEEQPQFRSAISRGALLRAERRVCAAADLVVATTEVIANKVARWGYSAHVVAGAGDPQRLAQDLPGVPDSGVRPIYVGALDRYKVDAAPLLAYAQGARDAALTIVGSTEFAQVDANVDELTALPNVTLLPQTTACTLDALLATATVGIVAGSSSRYSAGSFPLKVWDYLAMGLPVVAWGTPALKGIHPDVVYIDHPSGRAIQGAVTHLSGQHSSQQRQARRALAARHHPAQRVARLLALLPES